MPKSDEELFQAIAHLKNNPPEVAQALALLEGQQENPLGWMNKAREAMVGFLSHMNQAKSVMDGIDQRVQALGEEINQNPPPARMFDINTMLLHEVGQFKQTSENLHQEIQYQENSLKQAFDTNLPGWEADVGAFSPSFSEPPLVEESTAANPVLQAEPSDHSQPSAVEKSEISSESSGLADTWAQCGLPPFQDFANQVAPSIATGQPSVLIVLKLANIHKLLVHTPSNTLRRLAERIKETLKLETKAQDAFGQLDTEHMGLFLCNIRLPLAMALARRITAQLGIKVKGLDGKTHTLEIQTTTLASRRSEDSQTLLKRGLASFNTGKK